MVGQPGSLYFTGDLHCMMTLTCSVKKAFLFTFNPLFTVHRSFKSFAYVGTCLIISSKGILTFTCLNTSRISYALLIPFFPCKAWRKCGGVCFFIISSWLMVLSGSSFIVDSRFSFSTVPFSLSFDFLSLLFLYFTL